ncbi:MAG: hypothetical protein V1495_01035 [Pseudomonadota bacterium]
MRYLWLAALLISVSGIVSAESPLWVEGKDRPNERVNVDLKALSPDVYIRVAEKVDEAVVNVSTVQVIKNPHGGIFPMPFGNRGGRPKPRMENPGDLFGDDFFDRFFGLPNREPQEEIRQSSLGSGVHFGCRGIRRDEQSRGGTR